MADPRDVQDIIPTRLDQNQATSPSAPAIPTGQPAPASSEPKTRSTDPNAETQPAAGTGRHSNSGSDPSAATLPASDSGMTTGGDTRRTTGTFTRSINRTRTNNALPRDTQELDLRLQCSRSSVLSDMGRLGADRLPPGIIKLVDEHGTEGRYAIDKPLAQGGMGAVLLIRDGDFQRPAAMKVMLSKFASNAQALERFLDEAQITAQLEHPNIVPIHDLGIMDDGTVYFTMKFIEGESLGSVVKKLKSEDPVVAVPARALWSEERILLTFLKVLDGVSYAHSKGVVHRDIKPDNIMIGPHGEVLVVDWGIAKVLGKDQHGETVGVVHLRGDEALSQTMAGHAMGTLYYMPPEQATGDLERIGPPSDIYALGVTLYELISLKRPVTGTSAPDMLARIVAGELVPAKTAKPDINDDLAAVITKAIACDPERRYASCAAFADDLRRYLAGQAVLARRRNLIERAGAWIGAHKKQVIASGAGLGVAVFAAGGMYWYGSHAANRRYDQLVAEARSAAAAGDWESARSKADGVLANRNDAEALRIKDQALLELGRVAADKERKAAEAEAQNRANGLIAQARDAELKSEWTQMRESASAALKLVKSADAQELLLRADRKLADKRDRELAEKAGKSKKLGDELQAQALALPLLDGKVAELVAKAREAYGASAADNVAVPGLDRALADLGSLQARIDAALQTDARVKAEQKATDERLAQASAARTAVGSALAKGDLAAAAEQVAIACKLEPAHADALRLRDQVLERQRAAEAAAAAEAARIKARATAAKALGEAREAANRMRAAAEVRAKASADVARLDLALADKPLAAKTPVFQARTDLRLAETQVAEQWALAEGSARTAVDALASEPEHPDARAAHDLLVDLYQGRLGDARSKGALPEVAAFTNLLARLGVAPDGSRNGRLELSGPGALRIGVFQLQNDGSGRFLAVGQEVANAVLPAQPLELQPGRYELRWGDGDIASVVIEAGTGSALALPSAPLPKVPGTRPRWVPPVAGAAGFWLAETEVTVGQWEEFLADPQIFAKAQEGYRKAQEANGADGISMSLIPRVGPLFATWQVEEDAQHRLVRVSAPREIDRRRPISGISRDDAQTFCAWLGARSGAKIRLPTSSEFRRAASGGDPRRIYPWGSVFDYAFASTALPKTATNEPPAVASAASDRGPYGHRDLAGSVREWLSDPGLAHDARIAGGAWTDDSIHVFLCDYTESTPSASYNAAIGFRILIEQP